MPIMVKQTDGSYLKKRLDSEPDEVSTETVYLHIGGEDQRDLRQYRGNNIIGVRFGLRLFDLAAGGVEDTVDVDYKSDSARMKIIQNADMNISHDSNTYVSGILTLGGPAVTFEADEFEGWLIKEFTETPPKYHRVETHTAAGVFTLYNPPDTLATGSLQLVVDELEGGIFHTVNIGSSKVYIDNVWSGNPGNPKSRFGKMTFYDVDEPSGVTLTELASGGGPGGDSIAGGFAGAFLHMGA